MRLTLAVSKYPQKMKAKRTVTSISLTALLVFSLGLVGCAIPRNPVPLAQIANIEINDFPGVRCWVIDHKPDIQIDSNDSSGCSFLALSGGGAKGAFGVGFLNGWTDSGTRPEFKIVTGISTGALTAPLTFLGSEYDDELRESYTTIRTKDILHVGGILSILSIPFSESYASTKPLQNMIADMLTQDVLDAIAREHAKGRRLYICTTNLDAQRAVIWNMGAIASSGHPDALELFRKVMLASASIPGVFPPVFFDVDIDGKEYDEMHVDGSVINGMFDYGVISFAEVQDKGLCSSYVIKNGKLDLEAAQIRRRAFSISARSFSTLMKYQSWSDMTRLYNNSQKNNVDFNYVSFPCNYKSKGDEMFDPKEMKRLYDLGYSIAVSDNPWQKEIPFFRKDPEQIWMPAK